MLAQGPLAATSLVALPFPAATPTSTILQQMPLMGRQEFPHHPPSRFWAGIYGPDVLAPSHRNSLFVIQELPYHPSSHFRAGIQGPDVRSPVRDWIITVQEQPFHPGPSFWMFPNTSVPTLGAGIFLIQKQEQPFQALWPKPPLIGGTVAFVEEAFGYIIPL